MKRLIRLISSAYMTYTNRLEEYIEETMEMEEPFRSMLLYDLFWGDDGEIF